MIKTSAHFPTGKEVIYCVTAWQRVLHRRINNYESETFCGAQVHAVLPMQEAWSNYLNLCNGCFK